MTLPVALTCGEPAGIGPEIAARAWAALREEMCFFLIGDAAHVRAHVGDDLPVEVIERPNAAPGVMTRALPVLQHDFAGDLTPGTPNPGHAQGVIDAVARGVKLVRAGRAAALCTAPIHKKALKDGAGFAYPGHTEYLAALAEVDRVVMMLASDQLRVVPTTIHIPLKDVPEALTQELLEETIRITRRALTRQFAIASPRLAIAGLNPHAGEGGKMGREEIEIITPVIERLSAEGMDLIGPMSADTMFHAAARTGYDAAVAMYHDQALIPIKTLDFDRGVNITLGLPFVRTSPDHGTALDIAGKGVANPTSLIEALRLAATMGATRA